jgi:hypothetical protein
MTHPALVMIQQQLKELDLIFAQASKDLNTVAASERVAKWKAKTVPLIAQHVGASDAQRFAETKPGPSFTNDLLEELGDEVELYRDRLTALAARLNT